MTKNPCNLTILFTKCFSAKLGDWETPLKEYKESLQIAETQKAEKLAQNESENDENEKVLGPEDVPSPSKTPAKSYGGLMRPNDFECEICHKKFKQHGRLRSHLFGNASRNAKSKAKCLNCNKTFASTCGLKLHEKNCEKPDANPGQKSKPDLLATLVDTVGIDQNSIISPPKTELNTPSSDLKNIKIEALADINLSFETPKKKLKLEFDEITCNTCQETFENEKSFEKHLANGNAYEKCLKCNMKFYQTCLLNVHVKTCGQYSKNSVKSDKEKDGFHCVKCLQNTGLYKTFLSEIRLQRHIEMMHKDENSVKSDDEEEDELVENSPKPAKKAKIDQFECGKCQKTFETEDRLQKHTEILHKEKNHKCNQCDKSFSNSLLLSAHQSNEHGQKNSVKPFQCDICHNVFENQPSLNNHIRAQHVTSPKKPQENSVKLECDLCDRSFGNLNLFKRHYKLAHSMVRKIKCEICATNFRQTKDLKEHLQNGFGDYLCRFCEKFFLQQCGMKVHLEKCPKNPKILENGPKTNENVVTTLFPCNFCQESFKSEFVLQNHVKIMHEQSQEQENVEENVQFECDLCTDVFVHLDDFKDHYKSQHNMANQTQCDICDRVFKQPR